VELSNSVKYKDDSTFTFPLLPYVTMECCSILLNINSTISEDYLLSTVKSGKSRNIMAGGARM